MRAVCEQGDGCHTHTGAAVYFRLFVALVVAALFTFPSRFIDVGDV